MSPKPAGAEACSCLLPARWAGAHQPRTLNYAMGAGCEVEAPKSLGVCVLSSFLPVAV